MVGREPSWMCFQCGYVMDAYSNFDHPDASPEDGDLSLCMNCGARFVRDADRWRPLASAEYDALEPDAKRELLKLEMTRQHSALPDLAKGQGGRT